MWWLYKVRYNIICRGEPQTRTHGLGSRFRFHVKPVFPFTLCAYYQHLRRIPCPSLWLHPRNHSLVNTWESQVRAAGTIAHRFGHCICSKLKYMLCTKYVHVQKWIRACEQSVYVVCALGWFIKWVVIVTIIIFIYCNWVVTRWQWLFYMYRKHGIGYYWI